MFKLQAVYIYSIDHQCFLIMWDRCSNSYVSAFFTDVIIHSVRVVGGPLSPFPATRRYCQKHSKPLGYLDSETVRRSRDTATTDFFLSSWTCWMVTLCTFCWLSQLQSGWNGWILQFFKTLRWRHHPVMFTTNFEEYNHDPFRSSSVTVSLLDHFCIHPGASAIGSLSLVPKWIP